MMERKSRFRQHLKFWGRILMLWLVIFALVATAVAAITTVTMDTSDSGTFYGECLSYSYSATATANLPDENPNREFVSVQDGDALVEKLADDKLKVSAKTSLYYKKNDSTTGGCDHYYYAASVTITVTVKNNDAEKPLRIDRIEHGGNANLVFNDQPLTSGTTLQPGESFTITLTAEQTNREEATTQVTADDTITFSVTQLESVSLTAIPSDQVSYTVTFKDDNSTLNVTPEGNAMTRSGITAGTQATVELGAIQSGSFYGWRLSNGALVTGSPASIPIAEDISIYPVMISDGQSKPFQVNGTLYYFWEDAFRAAGSSGTVVLVGEDDQNYELPSTLKENGLAFNSSYVAMDADGNLTYTVGAGQTFIISHDDTKTALSTDSEDSGHSKAIADYLDSNQIVKPKEGSITHTLTIPASCTIQLAGTMAVGGELGSTTGIAGSTVGKHSNVELQGNIVVSGANAVFSCCGYVYGDGTVTVQNSGTVYEPFVVADFYGGTYTLGAAGKAATITTEIRGDESFIGQVGSLFSITVDPDPPGNPIAAGEEAAVFPFLRWAMLNVQSKLEILNGGKLKGYADLYAEGGHNKATLTIIDGDKGLLRVNGNTIVTCTYDEDSAVQKQGTSDSPLLSKIGTTTMTISGGASLGTLMIDIQISKTKTVTELGLTGELTAVINASISSANMAFPIPYNMNIVLEGAGSQYNLDRSMLLLPGSSLTVSEGAKLTIGSNGKLTVLPSLYDQKRVSSTGEVVLTDAVAYTNSGLSAYPTFKDLKDSGFHENAAFIVDGTLEIQGKIGGVIQTHGGSGRIITNGTPKSNLQATTQVGGVGNTSMTVNVGTSRSSIYSQTFDFYQAGATAHTLEAQIYNPCVYVEETQAYGKLISLEPDQVYQAIPVNDLFYSMSDYSYTVYTSSTVSDESKATISMQSQLNGGNPLDIQMCGGWYNWKADIYGINDNGDQLWADKIDTLYVLSSTDLSTIGYRSEPVTVSGTPYRVSGLYTDAAHTESAGMLTADAILYTLVNCNDLPVWVVTDGRKVGYLSLSDAASAYTDSGDYVQLNRESPVLIAANLKLTGDASFTRDTYLDLNGCTVNGSVSINGFLFGADSSSNGFKEPSGSIAVSKGTVKTVATVNGMDYVAIADEGTTTYQFHRFAITPTACRFYINKNSHSHMAFEATIQGDDTVLKKLQDLGFTVIDTATKAEAENWYMGDTRAETAPKLSNGGKVTFIALSYNKDSIDDPDADNQKLVAAYKVEYSVTAKAAFVEKAENAASYPDDVVVSSDGTHSISLQQALNDYVIGVENKKVEMEKTGDLDAVKAFLDYYKLWLNTPSDETQGG